MKKLISMVDFVLVTEGIQNGSESRTIKNTCFDSIVKYANFLKQPLDICMFIPCKLVDGVWVVLEYPHNHIHGKTYLGWEKSDYSEAKERVLFDGFELSYSNTVLSKNKLVRFSFNTNLTIEDLIKYNLQLTASAQKQIEG